MFISDLSNSVNQKVKLTGWVYNLRSSGKIRFILLRDGTGITQCVLEYSEETKNAFGVCETLTQESVVEVQGVVKKWKNGFEIQASDLRLISTSEPYPISKKEHGIDFLMNHRHLWMRSKKTHAVLRVRHHIIHAIHNFFNYKYFTQIDPPIFTPTACEGTSTLFEVQMDFMDSVYLSQSGQMYLEAASAAFNQVYCLSPTFRAEKSSTRRHLMEFWMCEAEMAFCDLNQNMVLIEEFIVSIIQYVLKSAKEELNTLGRDLSLLEKIKTPFPKLHYDSACEHLIKKNPQFIKGSDFGGADETLISSLYDQPVFVHHYPSQVKAFYMKQDNREGYSLSCDLLAPEGYGELVGGGQRETDKDVLIKAIQHHQLDQKDFEWYLDLRRYGSFVHSGFGLGVERLVSWLCGLDHVREAIPFPRVYGRKFFEQPSS
ncbi:MAG: asparagine--tRNA ligase [Bdellovibrionales bacterium]|nr:asparagine--tRNA ligase [Bdellovibrionales bacterium]